MASLTIHNIDPGIKSAAMEIMKLHGLTAKDTISAFLGKMVNDHRKTGDSCFCSDLELNEETKRDLREAKDGKVKYTACSNSPKDSFQQLCGIWKDRDTTLEDIRDKAWRRGSK